MFKRTRKVACTECNGANYWNANPRPSDILHCRYCHAAIMSYEEYVQMAAQQEAERLLAEFVETDMSRDLAHLKSILASPAQRISA